MAPTAIAVSRIDNMEASIAVRGIHVGSTSPKRRWGVSIPPSWVPDHPKETRVRPHLAEHRVFASPRRPGATRLPFGRLPMEKEPLQGWQMPADTLDRLLVTLAVRLHAFAVCEIKRGWRLKFAPMEGITIHYVLNGRGTLQASGKAIHSFAPHTIMIVPARIAQSLGDHRDTAREAASDEHCTIIDDGLVTFTAGDGTRDILVVCGTISATYGGALGLFDHLH